MKKLLNKTPVNTAVKKAILSSVLLTTMSAVAIQSAHAADTFTEAMTSGTSKVDLRLRYEQVDQDGTDLKANAYTLRTRLSHTTGDYQGLSGFIQMDDVTAFGNENYNSTQNGNGDRPVVADPTGTEVNQAYLKYTLGDTTVKYGRQEVVLDNARFVGNVGWRQNAQSFDALSVVNTSISDLTLIYGYVNNVNTITGGDTQTEAHILNAGYTGLPMAKISAYGYLLDLVDAPAASSQTFGLRAAGKADLSEGMKLLYTAEFAKQDAYQDGADTIDAAYYLIEAGVKASGITAKLGHEVLGGDGTFSFSTPLATKHAFNGWTDKFLDPTKVKNGLTDTYISVAGKVAGTKLKAIYHDFAADNGGDSYGSELGLLAAKKYGKHYKLIAKYASYKADTHSVDTDKFWLIGQASF